MPNKPKSADEKRKFTGFMLHPSVITVVQALADAAGLPMSRYVEALILKASSEEPAFQAETSALEVQAITHQLPLPFNR